MGSDGSGNFGAYPGGGVERVGGGAGEDDRCPEVIELIRLNDVGISQYYNTHKAVPGFDSNIEISKGVTNKRLVIILSDTKEVIGNVPVKYNSLSFCLNKGINYTGTITSSGLSPIPYIVVTVYAK